MSDNVEYNAALDPVDTDRRAEQVADNQALGAQGEELAARFLQVSSSGVNDKLAQIDATLQRTTAATELGIPGFGAISGRACAP
ncbi:hypothetical protein [Nocardia sp. CA-135398]|uniref:hypothetical protein n=1 Tax=Nocardia sp. CA-135398 TaxID=3239977 RepID=UPI003D9878B0